MHAANIFRKKKIIVAAIVLVGILVLVFWKSPKEGPVELRVAGLQSSNGVVVLTVYLTNGMPRPMNVVDDVFGNPFFSLLWDGNPGIWISSKILEYPENYRSSITSFALTPGTNQLKLNLSPGQCVTNAIVMTNPPPRFRLRAEARDVYKNRLAARLVEAVYRASFGTLDLFENFQLEPRVPPLMTPWIDVTNSPTTKSRPSTPAPPL